MIIIYISQMLHAVGDAYLFITSHFWKLQTHINVCIIWYYFYIINIVIFNDIILYIVHYIHTHIHIFYIFQLRMLISQINTSDTYWSLHRGVKLLEWDVALNWDRVECAQRLTLIAWISRALLSLKEYQFTNLRSLYTKCRPRSCPSRESSRRYWFRAQCIVCEYPVKRKRRSCRPRTFFLQ
jgi:hypothetical protein